MGEVPKEVAHIKPESLEKIRRAMIEVLEEPARTSKGAISAEKVRAIARANNNTCATVLRAWRAGELSLAEDWGEPPAAQGEAESPAAGLAKLLREARTDADRQKVLDEAQALALEGRIPAATVQALAPQLRAPKREAEPEAAGPGDLLPATREAIPLIEAFEGIAGDARRQLVLAFALEQLERDRREGPQAITARDEGAKEAG